MASAAGAVDSPTSTGPSPSAVPSACALLQPSDLMAAFGGSVDAGDLTSAPNGGETICQWVVTAKNGNGFGAQLDVKTPFSTKAFAQQRRIANGPTKTVKHLGDAAFSERAKVAGHVFDDLWVHEGKVAFRLEVLADLGTAPLERLAATVLTNLGSSAGH